MRMTALAHVDVQGDDLEGLARRALMKLIEAEREQAAGPWRIPAGTTLTTLANQWLDGMKGSLDDGTIGLYRDLHFGRHLIPHFNNSPQTITHATIADYGRQRLRVVKRKTLQKERSALRGFLSWCVEQGYLTGMPEFPLLPRRAIGTAFATRRRGKATDLSPEECRAVIAVLRKWSRPRADEPLFPVRARFIVMHETALRPATLDALSVPEHYSRGADKLVITDGIDKARFGRVVPLTEEARRALDSVAPKVGLIFGKHNYRAHLNKAARKVLPESKARTFAAYDFRHARLTELAGTGNLPGVAYLAGHKQVTTTSIYVRPHLRAAEAVLEAGGDRCSSSGEPANPRCLLSLTASELRAMKPPEGAEQGSVEWQELVNARANELELRERRDLMRRTRKQRCSAPKDDASFDELVMAKIASGCTAKHRLRATIATSWERLRASLARLRAAGRI